MIYQQNVVQVYNECGHLYIAFTELNITTDIYTTVFFGKIRAIKLTHQKYEVCGSCDFCNDESFKDLRNNYLLGTMFF